MPGEVNRDPVCLFCRIVDGEIPSITVHEDDSTLAFMDISPATDGHLLVIPKKHAKDLGEIGADDLAAVTSVAQKLARVQLDKLGATGVNLINNWGESAWQSVFHFHLHVIPRYADDPAKDSLKLPWNPTPGDQDRIAAAAAALTD
ncbi:HIT family protein [Nocardioides acrostichi]|uniref:HIT family protein n=1 Tax=Nocardioides acrostichi TaxID=2784339 RepID=A0A930UUI4_9ACTN|nr:HIT family protein [Nocardioides acrostichi]MBF4161098.1 HIT family protein [Nocardioides acrostichi]